MPIEVKYEVRYRCPEISGICVLPVWIKTDSNNVVGEARKILSDICPNGFEIVNIKIGI